MRFLRTERLKNDLQPRRSEEKKKRSVKGDCGKEISKNFHMESSSHVRCVKLSDIKFAHKEQKGPRECGEPLKKINYFNLLSLCSSRCVSTRMGN